MDSYEGPDFLRVIKLPVSTAKRLLWILCLTVCVGCTVWTAWQLFTDANRVVTALVAGTVALAVARPAISNLVWAISLLFWKPHKWMDSFYEWLRSPQVIVDVADTTLPSGTSARDLLEHVVHEGAPADRDAAAEALSLLPSDGQPSVQQVQDAKVALGGSPVVKAWKALDDLAA